MSVPLYVPHWLLGTLRTCEKRYTAEKSLILPHEAVVWLISNFVHDSVRQPEDRPARRL